MKKIQAIDFMYYVATREFMEQWDRAKEGELICRMEKAIGGLPRFASIEEMLRQMDEAGVEKVFITQCKMWSYWRKWMYMDTKLEDVLQYTEKYPDRFVGLAGYNPFRIKESLQEIELAVTKHELQRRLCSHLRLRHSAERREDVSAVCEVRRAGCAGLDAGGSRPRSDAQRRRAADVPRSHCLRFS